MLLMTWKVLLKYNIQGEEPWFSHTRLLLLRALDVQLEKRVPRTFILPAGWLSQARAGLSLS